MTKRKNVFCLFVVLISLFLVPFGYLANAEEKAPVTVYMFHGSTCPHCKDGIAFFKKLLGNSEFEGMFQVRTIEVWENQNNSELANKACEKMGDEPINGSVPYIVIGDKTFGGYSSASDESIKTAIKNAYNNNTEDKLKDLMGNAGELLEAEKSNMTTTIIVLLVAVAIIGGTVFFARSGVEEEEDAKEEKKEETPKKEIKADEEVTETVSEEKKQSTKKNTTKKTNTKKTSTKKASTTKKKN